MTSVERLRFLSDKGDECWLGLTNVEAIKDVLNELEKKDAKIERLKNARDNWKKTYYQSEAELKKAEQVIDEMAKFLAQTDIDEAICKDIEYCTADDEYTNCYKCIKEYFYKKARDHK